MDLLSSDTATFITTLLTVAWLLPLLGFVLELLSGFSSDRHSKFAALFAVFCIGAGFVCSATALWSWGSATNWVALEDHGHGAAGAHAPKAQAGHHDEPDANASAAVPDDVAGAEHADDTDGDHHAHDAGHAHDHDHSHALAAASSEHSPESKVAHGAGHAGTGQIKAVSGTYYTLARFGSLVVSLDYYIDSLTLVMFTMVTLIATCIHIFAIGYMSDELTENYVDHQVHTSHGHLHRPGRFYRFFAFLSLFSFSMLGLVIAGNIFLVFVFWELVGVCSYFLIGFYVERKSASSAANKAFIMNRVGDFGFLIGLMILWTWFGTFQFGEIEGRPQGLFSLARGTDGQLLVEEPETGGKQVVFKDLHNHALAEGTHRSIPYFLLIAAGLGIFAGCVGKSAQFPLQTWLPDAMEGPTPVSALVHSATMVAAGVYLVGRFYPMFMPEVLLTIAYIGCITLFLAATIAVVATDIKRVLAYSTISQLGYMMLGLGLGGWGAGLFHLVTHAFFKSLMFLCSGSVIYGCHHVQEMPQMGGLRRKMPITAYTMLVGVIAIAGLAIPGTEYLFGERVAFSGYHSKDAVLATSLTFMKLNGHVLLFLIPLAGAGITAFYMFRLWFYTFAGKPRDHHVYEHAHESPRVMTLPLIVLSVFAAFVAIRGEAGPLFKLLTFSEPVGLADGIAPLSVGGLQFPGHAAVAANHAVAGTYALLVALGGAVVAYLFYGIRLLDPAEIQKQFSGLYAFLANKWCFDDLYDVLFVRPVHVIAAWCTAFDRNVLDGFLHGTCKVALNVSHWDRKFDELFVDGLVNLVGNTTYSAGQSLKGVQTGLLRNYVMFIALGVLGMFMLLIVFFPG